MEMFRSQEIDLLFRSLWISGVWMVRILGDDCADIEAGNDYKTRYTLLHKHFSLL